MDMDTFANRRNLITIKTWRQLAKKQANLRTSLYWSAINQFFTCCVATGPNRSRYAPPQLAAPMFSKFGTYLLSIWEVYRLPIRM
jgi:hypothetical protein